jgi:hypothetical protein
VKRKNRKLSKVGGERKIEFSIYNLHPKYRINHRANLPSPAEAITPRGESEGSLAHFGRKPRLNADIERLAL